MTKILLAFAAVVGVAGLVNAQGSRTYNSLLGEVQQWQLNNKENCGIDTSSCGVMKMVDGFQSCKGFRVVNGCNVEKPLTVGWQVAIHFGDSLCSGVLVSDQVILLAAHCVEHVFSASQIRVFFATRNIHNTNDGQSQIVGASAFAYNPAWDATAHTSDSAFIKLSRPVSLSTPSGIRAACLPTANTPLPYNQQCLVSGFGISDWHDQESAGEMRYTILQILDDRTCEQAFGNMPFDERYVFCALGQHRQHASDACSGDSGSGLMCKDSHTNRWTVRGIVSYGTPHCADLPGVFADTAKMGIVVQPTQRDMLLQDECKTSLPSPSPQPQPQPAPVQPLTTSKPPVSVGGSGNRKPGGVSATLQDTIREHGCMFDSNCTINVCRPVALCTETTSGMPSASSTMPKFPDFPGFPKFPTNFPNFGKFPSDAAGSHFPSTSHGGGSGGGTGKHVRPRRSTFVSTMRRSCQLQRLCWTDEWLQQNSIPKIVFNDNNNNNNNNNTASSLASKSQASIAY